MALAPQMRSATSRISRATRTRPLALVYVLMTTAVVIGIRSVLTPAGAASTMTLVLRAVLLTAMASAFLTKNLSGCDDSRNCG